MKTKTKISIALIPLLAAVWSGVYQYTRTPKYIVNHLEAKAPGDLSKNMVLGSTTKENRAPQEHRRKTLEDALVGKERPISINLMVAFDSTTISIETDEAYANKLILLGKDSINHMINYVNSPLLANVQFDFKRVKNSNDADISSDSVDATNSTNVFIVRTVGEQSKTIYRVRYRNGETGTLTTIEDHLIAGEHDIHLHLTGQEKGFKLNGPIATPIWYGTCATRVSAVETFAIEALHRMVRPITQQHIAAEAATINRTTDALYALLQKWADREETVVHAISIPWLRRYNIDRKLGISDAELEERFLLYDQNPSYKNVTSFAKIVEQKGPRKVIEDYATEK